MKHPKCILLKLLSWDARQAKSKDSTWVDDTDRLNFKRVVRVIYEFTNDREREHDSSDPMSWTWGGVDLCCLPESSGVREPRVDDRDESEQATAASVRLWLSEEEWNELHDTLQENSKYF